MNLHFLKRVVGISFARSSISIASNSIYSSLLTVSPSRITFYRNAVSSPSREEEDAQTIVFPREGPGVSYGLNWALASKGVIVKDKAFRNLNSTELLQKGATTAIESLSGLPVHTVGKSIGDSVEISNGQFTKLLKQVGVHLSCVPNIFVHDGAIGSYNKCDVKARVISDCPSAVFSLSNILWSTPTRAVSHDTCPLIIYVSTSISPNIGVLIGHDSPRSNDIIASNIDQSILMLCGKAFSDTNTIKEVLYVLSERIITARYGLPLSGRIITFRDYVFTVFAPEDVVSNSSDVFVTFDKGLILSAEGVSPFFKKENSPSTTNLFQFSAVVLTISDSTGAVPSLSKLSAEQAACHFLAGYQDGKFFPAYNEGRSSLDTLDVATAFFERLKDAETPAYLINVVGGGGKRNVGEDFLKTVQSIPSAADIPQFPSEGDIQMKITRFLSEKFKELPEELSL